MNLACCVYTSTVVLFFLKKTTTTISLLSVPSVPVWSQVLSAQPLLLFLLHALLWLCVWRGQGVVSAHLHLCGMFPGSLRSHGGPHLPG